MLKQKLTMTLNFNKQKQIVEMFEGRIELDQNYNDGCQFLFSIKAEQKGQSPYSPLRQSNNSSIYNTRSMHSSFKFQDIEMGNDLIDNEKKLVYTNRGAMTEQSMICQTKNFNVLMDLDQNGDQMNLLHDENKTILDMNFKLKVHKATNGLEATVKIKDRYVKSMKCSCKNKNSQETYKLIFMDCNMPIMDGFQATQEIRQFEQKNNIHQASYIVALTAYSTDIFSNKCKESGMDDFTTKPISVDTIQKILSSTLFK
ncbi:histidine kinase [Stylonychia lemnae]|uniref:Histidine kinase n=1 Tax=Stylonychia lemnae TaxID=5949 RepID=A0A078AKT5_STYLE|nr:histidine kinase [Stylonychia lemnae]|eukprot:CDW82501.1 histidine kinase [Stylonychia lemnae]